MKNKHWTLFPLMAFRMTAERPPSLQGRFSGPPGCGVDHSKQTDLFGRAERSRTELLPMSRSAVVWDGADPAGSCQAGVASKPQRLSNPAPLRCPKPSSPAARTHRDREVPSEPSDVPHNCMGGSGGTFPHHMQQPWCLKLQLSRFSDFVLLRCSSEPHIQCE